MPNWMLFDVTREREARLGGHRRQDPVEDGDPRQQRQHAVALGLAPPELLQLLHLLRVLGRDVLAWEKSVVRSYSSQPTSRSGSQSASGPNGASVGGDMSQGRRSGREAAHQPSLYIARAPNISKYCDV